MSRGKCDFLWICKKQSELKTVTDFSKLLLVNFTQLNFIERIWLNIIWFIEKYDLVDLLHSLAALDLYDLF